MQVPILIGSRAAKHYFADFREPIDHDFLVSEEWLHSFFSENYDRIVELTPAHDGIKYRCKLVSGEKLEFEIIEKVPSSVEIARIINGRAAEDVTLLRRTRFGFFSLVAPTDILFLLKKAHVEFDIHWEKNIADYTWFAGRVMFSPELELIRKMRSNEVEVRLKVRKPNFKKSNADFFKDAVGRQYPHDELHEWVAFYDRPIFYWLKDDPETAEVSEQRWDTLTRRQKIQAIQEEAMVLALERWILPGKSEPQSAYSKAVKALCTRLLPNFMQWFAIDNHSEVMKL